MKKYLLLILLGFSFSINAGTPTCHTHPSGNYCQYTGKVKEIYVNSSDWILLYFDTPLDVNVPQGLGINAVRGGAAIVKISNNPEFAKLFYSTALTAQASGRDVTIQLRGVQSGYLQADRIWLPAP